MIHKKGNRVGNRKRPLVEVIQANVRPHAGYFSWETNRALAEAGVLDDFMDALEENGKPFFRDPFHRGEGNDPPDLEAKGLDGTRIGIEVSELVDGSAAAAARAGRPYEWNDLRGVLIPRLAEILKRKDCPASLKDPPYSQYLLLVHSDELSLDPDYVERSLQGHTFASTNIITRAFLLLSYDPLVKKCPFYELLIGSKSK